MEYDKIYHKLFISINNDFHTYYNASILEGLSIINKYDFIIIKHSEGMTYIRPTEITYIDIPKE